MEDGEGSAAAKSPQITDSSFRKSLYALEQWPSAIESLRNQNQSPEFANMIGNLIDRTLSELEVVSSLVDKQSKKQELQESKKQELQGGDKGAETAPNPGPSAEKGEEAGHESSAPAENPKRPCTEEAAPQQEEVPKPPVVKKARMKYTPLRKPSV
uniref:Protein ovary overexpressed n=1 Tax=Rhipicephalus microplus TaxID=6941 RepID=A0A6M2CYJ4_RHIMP